MRKASYTKEVWKEDANIHVIQVLKLDPEQFQGKEIETFPC